jgi:hypothetical protein
MGFNELEAMETVEPELLIATMDTYARSGAAILSSVVVSILERTHMRRKELKRIRYATRVGMKVHNRMAEPREVAEYEAVLNWVQERLRDALVENTLRIPKRARRLIEQLKDKDRYVRDYAAAELGELGTATVLVVVALYEALSDSEESVAVRAARALGKLGANAVPILIEAMKDEKSEVRMLAAFALMMMGPDAKPAVETLRAATNDPNRSVALQATFALGRIPGDVAQA